MASRLASVRRANGPDHGDPELSSDSVGKVPDETRSRLRLDVHDSGRCGFPGPRTEDVEYRLAQRDRKPVLGRAGTAEEIAQEPAPAECIQPGHRPTGRGALVAIWLSRGE